MGELNGWAWGRCNYSKIAYITLMCELNAQLVELVSHKNVPFCFRQ